MTGHRLAEFARSLESYRGVGLLSRSDVYAAVYIAQALTESPSTEELLGLASAIRATQVGNVCVDLVRPEALLGRPHAEADDEVDSYRGIPDIWPALVTWDERLAASSFVHHVRSWEEAASVTHPLVRHGTRLYTARQWEDERSVAEILARRFAETDTSGDVSVVESLFPGAAVGDLQVTAVRRSLERRTSILLGGPGTGKTFTIARILSALLSVHGEETRIALAAPTAKAATQMRESLLKAVSGPDHPFPVAHVDLLRQLEPMTVHRLLGRRRRANTRFAHDLANPLDVDVVVVDEMSMVSLPLMARLLEALPESCRLVLVGDPDQLASVENGSILPDLARLHGELPSFMTRLTVSQRNRDSVSAAVTEAIRDGDSDAVQGFLDSVGSKGSDDGTFTFIDVDNGLEGAKTRVDAMLENLESVRSKARSGEVQDALDEVGAFRLVCAHRRGNYGVERWNDFVLDELFGRDRHWSVGNIVVKNRNDVGNGLANGDTGVVVGLEGGLGFAFLHGTEVILRPTSAVDDVDLAFATTVHKAQGSEFGTVAVMVPPATSPLCTRELLYTAATRAKPNLILIGTRADIRHAIETRDVRFSGLEERLRAALQRADVESQPPSR